MYRHTKQSNYADGFECVPVVSMREELMNLADGGEAPDVLSREQSFQFKSGEKPVMNEIAGLMFVNRMQAGIDGFQPEYFSNVRARLGLTKDLSPVTTTD